MTNQRPVVGVGDTIAGVCLCHGQRIHGGVVCDEGPVTITVLERMLAGDNYHAIDGRYYTLVERLADSL